MKTLIITGLSLGMLLSSMEQTASAQALPPPENLRTALWFCSSVYFEWEAPARGDLIGYHFFRQEQAGGAWSSPLFIPPDVTRHVESGWLPNCYRVSALYPDGESSPAQSCGGMIADAWMFPPSYVHLKTEGDSIQVNWDHGSFGCGAPVGYEISRRHENGDWSVIARVPHGTTTFVDRNLENGRWCYFVTIVSTQESLASPIACDTLVSTVVNDQAETLAPNRNFNLQQNHPNPFNPSTTISFDLPRTSQVEIAVFDLLGKRVRTLVQERQQAGQHRLLWDGRDDSGVNVPSGVYLYRLQAGEFTQTRKMILMH